MADSSPAVTARSDFETAQHRVFKEAGINPQSRFLDLEKPRVRTHVIEASDLNDDPPVLFIHGVTGFGAMFAPLMSHLDSRRMIAIDRPGWGLSGDFIYTPETHRQTAVNVLKSVLDELGIEQVDLVGHSTGGYWSILFGLTHPHRVRRLILIGAIPAFPGTRSPISVRLFTVPTLNRVISRFQEPSEEGMIRQMKIVGESETIQRYPALLSARVAHNRIPQRIDVGLSEFRSFSMLRGWRSIARLRAEEVRELQQSTLFIWGDSDFLGEPDDVRESIELMPDARLEVVDAGHIPWLGHPEKCAQFVQEMRT